MHVIIYVYTTLKSVSGIQSKLIIFINPISSFGRLNQIKSTILVLNFLHAWRTKSVLES